MVGKATLVMSSIIIDGVVFSLFWQGQLRTGIIRFFEDRLLNLV